MTKDGVERARDFKFQKNKIGMEVILRNDNEARWMIDEKTAKFEHEKG
jgi:hypothetical protein